MKYRILKNAESGAFKAQTMLKDSWDDFGAVDDTTCASAFNFYAHLYNSEQEATNAVVSYLKHLRILKQPEWVVTSEGKL